MLSIEFVLNLEYDKSVFRVMGWNTSQFSKGFGVISLAERIISVQKQ